ncbi:MAG TPA: enoyl-CoA hydratase-related protein [Nitrolancea sp.]|nr:enoyl-CoA hydratase-related protein [Nitrolancea sp.]
MTIDIERADQIATITINRPEALNALDAARLKLLLARIKEAGDDPDIRVIILTGADDRSFAAGADIATMREMHANQALAFAKLGQAACDALESAPQPVIAAVNGYALGGGCEIALACDIRICSENAIFGQPEVTLGIPPGWGGTQRLARLVGPGIAKEMIYTGRRLTAQQALAIGLVNEVYPLEQLMDSARELAARISVNAPVAVRFSKAAINRAFEGPLADGLAEEARLFSEAFNTADQREGMSAFLARRKPRFQGK